MLCRFTHLVAHLHLLLADLFSSLLKTLTVIGCLYVSYQKMKMEKHVLVMS